MNSNLKCVLAFSFGATIGSIVAWKLLEKKYKEIALEQIDSVKEACARKLAKAEVDEVETEEVDEEETVDNDIPKVSRFEKPDIHEYAARLKNMNYKNYASIDTDEGVVVKVEEVDDVDRPYVISPEEYDELDDYDAVSLTYYEGDGVLTDDMDVPVENVDDVVGSDFMRHFGEYEDDSVFIRNDLLKTDYEILADVRKYSDVVNMNPHSAEDE